MGGKGSGGHNRKTTAQRKTEGNAGHRPLNEAEPVPLPGEIKAPEDLSALERTFWDQVCPIVTGMKVMTTADVYALKQLCRFLAEEEECSRQLAKLGRLIPKKNEEGHVIGAVLNPIARLRSDAARHVRAYLAVFGLGPSFRAGLKVSTPDDPPSDPLADVIRAKTSSDIVQ